MQENKTSSESSDGPTSQTGVGFGNWIASIWKDKAARVACFIAFFFLLFGLANLKNFGATNDEVNGWLRGTHTVRIIHRLIGGSSAVSLNDDLADPGGLSYHPSFYAACNYLTERSMNGIGWTTLPAGHLLNVLIASAGLVLLYLLGREWFNRRVGLTAVVFMALFPRYISHAQNNPKDIPLLVFSIPPECRGATAGLVACQRRKLNGLRRFGP